MSYLEKPEYSFTRPDTLLFLTGAPSVGKTTVAPLVVSRIAGCTIQNMDILRILAQEIENTKPEDDQNPFVRYGACDSYTFVEDGSYSPQSLVGGFNQYANAIGSLLEKIVPELNGQGAQNVLFEGVQLAPEVVSPFLSGDNKLFVITADEARLKANITRRYSPNEKLLERYSVDRLLILQDEFFRQGKQMPPDKVFFINNNGDYTTSAESIIRLLIASGVIK